MHQIEQMLSCKRTNRCAKPFIVETKQTGAAFPFTNMVRPYFDFTQMLVNYGSIVEFSPQNIVCNAIERLKSQTLRRYKLIEITISTKVQDKKVLVANTIRLSNLSYLPLFANTIPYFQCHTRCQCFSFVALGIH